MTTEGPIHNAARFTLTIEIGNAAMTTTDDIRNTLAALAANSLTTTPDTPTTFRDINGNTVGRYEFTYDRADIINLETETP